MTHAISASSFVVPTINPCASSSTPSIQVGPAGWPANTIAFQDGCGDTMHLVLAGNGTVQIFGQGQCPTDQPIAGFSGDPHWYQQGNNTMNFQSNCAFDIGGAILNVDVVPVSPGASVDVASSLTLTTPDGSTVSASGLNGPPNQVAIGPVTPNGAQTVAAISSSNLAYNVNTQTGAVTPTTVANEQYAQACAPYNAILADPQAPIEEKLEAVFMLMGLYFNNVLTQDMNKYVADSSQSSSSTQNQTQNQTQSQNGGSSSTTTNSVQMDAQQLQYDMQNQGACLQTINACLNTLDATLQNIIRSIGQHVG